MKVTKITNVNLAVNHFLYSQNVKKHLHSVHEGHKDYKFESCEKSFSDAGNLKKHEGKKDFNCESCGKLFTTAQYLKKHSLTIHEGHKDYKCKSCGKSFSKAPNLKTHINALYR